MKFRKPWWVDEYLLYWSRFFIGSGIIGTFELVALKPYLHEDVDPMAIFYLFLAMIGLGIVLYVILCVIADPRCPNQGDDGTQ